MISKDLARETIAILAPAARAFDKAQRKGYAWVGDQGTFETWEERGVFTPTPPANPDQLRLA